MFFVVPVKVDAGVNISFPVSGYDVVLFEIGKEVFGMHSSTYSIPKSSTISEKMIGRHLCKHSPGVVATS